MEVLLPGLLGIKKLQQKPLKKLNPTSDNKVTFKFKTVTAIGRSISTTLPMQHTVNLIHLAVYSMSVLEEFRLC